MLAIKLALRNLIGAGLRTWLNVFVLSLSYVVIIWNNGLLDGWNEQARDDTIKWEIGGGVYWNENYDPYDFFTLEESHAKLPEELQEKAEAGEAAPVLIAQGTLYPGGRMRSVLIKGIPANQSILALPTNVLSEESEEIPIVIGSRMASDSRLNVGDYVDLRWRDKNGAFDAGQVRISGIFKTTVPSVDQGIIWVDYDRLGNMLQAQSEATLIVMPNGYTKLKTYKAWDFKEHDFLLKDMDEIIARKSIGSWIFYIILMMLAMLAVFDTQVLSIFRRQKEIGTHIALGMTKTQVVTLFTIEGAMHGILAAVMAAVYGIPLLSIQAIHGFDIPGAADNYGLAASQKIFPKYSLGLVLGTVLIVMITTIIVSYLPTRRITKMNPTDAIRGKIQ